MPKPTIIVPGSAPFSPDPDLIVIYLYADSGKPAAPPVSAYLKPGESFLVRSPKIGGYDPNIPVVSGQYSSKRKHTIGKVVLYRKKKAETPPQQE